MRKGVSVKETCGRVGVGVTKVYQLLDEGRLKSIVIGRRRIIFDDSIDALLSEAA